MDRTRGFLLLILSLITGCDASSKSSCTETWAECNYPEDNEKYNTIEVLHKKDVKRITEADVWENAGSYFLYHDTREKQLRVVFLQSQRDVKNFKCKFYGSRKSEPITKKLETDNCDCQTSFTHAQKYRTDEITFPCGNSGIQFFCKQSGSTCEKISKQKNSDMSLSVTNSGVFIRDVSSQHQGVYWCGLKQKGHYCQTLMKTQLQVLDIPVIVTNSRARQNIKLVCSDPTNAQGTKMLCKRKDPSACESVVSTSKKNSGRFSLNDEGKGNVTISVTDVRADDAGTYWCGVQRESKHSSVFFFTELLLTVGPASEPPSTASFTAPAASVSSTTLTHPSAEPQTTVTTAALVSVALLVLVLVLVLVWVYKRSEGARSRAAQADRQEDNCYAEIQEGPQKADKGTAMKSTYATATFPTNPSAFLHGSTVASVSGDTYSTVTDGGRRSSYATVGLLPGVPAQAVYSTVSLPQL